MTPDRQNFVVVCHQIRSPENLGSVARLLANFGFLHLVLSEPLTYAVRDGEKTAVRATQRLEKMQLFPTLREAVAGATYAVGTTSRDNVRGRRLLSPEDAASQLASRARQGRVALVLGGEKRGLSDEELALCQDITCIPTDAAQPSMNLSHAAAVLLYLCARSLEGERTDPPAQVPAPLAILHALEEEMKRVLLASRFLNPQAPEHVLRELVRTLESAQLGPREAELWLSAFRHLGRGRWTSG